MYTVELVECKDHPKEVAQEITDDPRFGATILLLLQLCKSIFHIGMVVILDSGFCVLRAIIELTKRGFFASTLRKKGDIGLSMLMEMLSTYTLIKLLY